jgi:DNA replication protein DnaC
MMKEKLRDLMQTLKFKGMAKAMDEVLLKAEREGLSTSHAIHALLLEEQRYREETSLKNRLHNAQIPWEWTIHTFPFDRQPGVNKTQVLDLCGLSFVQRADNLIFIGDPGVGKTGLAISLLRQAILSGYRGRFYNAQDLLDELHASLADRSTTKFLKMICSYDILLVDELGYLSLKPEQANAFFKLMGERYGRKATVITTNLDYPEWYELFKKKPLVDALLDRLKHYCITIRINGPSLRVPKEERVGTPAN